MEKLAKIICSYLKMNNKVDTFKILLNTYGFIITQNNHKLFEYINESYYIYISFYIPYSLYKCKIINPNKQIFYIRNPKIIRDYKEKYVSIFNNNLYDKNNFIKYNLNKNYIYFYISINNVYFNLPIKKIRCNKFIFKIKNYVNSLFCGPMYINYKIFIPNKYELLYYSNYFHVYL